MSKYSQKESIRTARRKLESLRASILPLADEHPAQQQEPPQAAPVMRRVATLAREDQEETAAEAVVPEPAAVEAAAMSAPASPKFAALIQRIRTKLPTAAGFSALIQRIRTKLPTAAGFSVLIQRIRTKLPTAAGFSALIQRIRTKLPTAAGFSALIRRIRTKLPTAAGFSALIQRIRTKLPTAAGFSALIQRVRTKLPTAAGFSALIQRIRGKKTTVIRQLRRVRRRMRHVAREEKARGFPESDQVPVQFILFARNMLPVAGRKLREHTWGRRRQSMDRIGLIHGKFEHKKVRPLPFFAAAAAVICLTLFFSFYTVATTVTYEGHQMASVASTAAADDARVQLEQITTRALGSRYAIDENLIQYSSGFLPRAEVVEPDVLEENLSEQIGLVSFGYSLYVDGELIGSTPYEGALEELLQQLKDGITDENTISCDFAEVVEIKPGYVATDQILNLGYLAETLYSTKTAEMTYTVKSGDTWSEIANGHELSSSELLALNPGYDINRLSIGEVLTLSASVPYLTLTVVEQERYLADLPYDVEFTGTADLYKGDYKVLSAGEYGSADMVANVTYVNGEEMERVVLSSVTLKNPVTEQRLEGTKDRPTWLPTGTFRWPCSGNITSRYGYRNLSYSYASTNHKGIDIANRYGTAVCAADGGTVVYSGWMSGYGYMVQIDHGNGYVTYYGHNSSLIVSVGDHVYKGQQLARMGSTGNSTGNHCHFEIRYDGVSRNPLNYLP